MLVLTRKLRERILVPQWDLTITVLAIEGNKVRLGITAPREVDIYREEILARQEQEAGVSCSSEAEQGP